MSRFRDEIGKQPELLSALLDQSGEAVATIGTRIRETAPRGFLIAARGSSDHAALYAKYLFGARNRTVVALAAPSLFTHYGRAPRLDGYCVVGISQSGESPDVIAVVDEAVRQGALTFAITNHADSHLARVAQLVLPLGVGPELSVPASKTYTASLLALALISQNLDPDDAFETALSRVPESVEHAIEQEARLERLVPPLTAPRAIVLGRGFNFSTAAEIALKLTETSYVLARAWSVADFEHGPIAVVEPGFPVLVVRGGGPVAADLESITQRLAEVGCEVLQLIDGATGDQDPSRTVRMDAGLPEALTPITLTVLGQLLSHRLAVARGIDPDTPRALRKVTQTW